MCWLPWAAALPPVSRRSPSIARFKLRSVQATVEADQDVHGILGADPQIRNGFSGVRVSYTIDADATTEQIKALVAQSQKRSAVYDILTTPPTSPSACPEQGDAAPRVRKPTRRSGRDSSNTLATPRCGAGFGSSRSCRPPRGARPAATRSRASAAG